MQNNSENSVSQAAEQEPAAGTAASGAPPVAPAGETAAASKPPASKPARKKKASKKKASKKGRRKKRGKKKATQAAVASTDNMSRVLAAVEELREAIHELASTEISHRRKAVEDLRAAAREKISDLEIAAQSSIAKLTGKG